MFACRACNYDICRDCAQAPGEPQGAELAELCAEQEGQEPQVRRKNSASNTASRIIDEMAAKVRASQEALMSTGGAPGATDPSARPDPNGSYRRVSVNHGNPVFKHVSRDVFVYYWDARDGDAWNGWWLAPAVESNTVWGFNKSTSGLPPATGWSVPYKSASDPGIQFICGDACTSGTDSAKMSGVVSEKPAGKDECRIRRVTLPNGETRIACPACEETFGEEDKALLLDHCAKVHGRVLWWPGISKQADSEGMDVLGEAMREYPRVDEALQRLHVISLGSFCGVKLAIQRLGLGSAHLPFDWIRTTTAGLVHFVQSGFEDFFSVASQSEVGNMKVFRSSRHSFWHDDVQSAEGREKLKRRIDRFLALQDDPKDLLFVRSCDSTDGLRDVEELYRQLCARFAPTDPLRRRRLLLLVVVDGQESVKGPILHEHLPGLMFYAQPLVFHSPNAPRESQSETYLRAISFAVDAALEVRPGDSDGGFGLAGSRHPTARSGAALLGAGGDGDPTPKLKPCHAHLESGIEGLRSFEDAESPHINLWPQFQAKPVLR